MAREENFSFEKPRYSEVHVISRRVIARYDCSCKFVVTDEQQCL